MVVTPLYRGGLRNTDQSTGNGTQELSVLYFSRKMLFYRGVHKDGFLQPHDLAEYHVVLTTYETLRKELDYADLNTTDGHRYKKCCVTWCVV